MNKKIVMSLSVIAAVSAVVIGGTGAFFSDSETSTGNTFTAGAIDLKVDSEQHYNGHECIPNPNELTATNMPYVWGPGTNPYPVEGTACDGTWKETDLGPTQQFFDFGDVKPGDEGSNSISLHVINNDAYMCAAVSNLKNDDLGLTEPEQSAPANDTTNGVGNGELKQAMLVTIWKDTNGDNIQDGGEPVLYGPGPAQEGVWPLYTPAMGALAGGTTAWLGVKWDLPLATGNEVQTDSLMADISFRVEQARNNAQFTCGGLTPAPQWVNTGTRTSGDASFIEEAGRGNVLQLTTIADNDSRVRWTNNNLNLNLSTFTGVSYESKQVSAIDLVNGNASMRLFIDKDGNLLTADIEEITHEPYYNIAAYNPLNPASILSNTWQTWSTTLADGKFWGNGGFLGTTPGGGAYATNVTLAQVLASYPSAKIVGISLGMGTYNPGQVILVDNLILNGAPMSLEN